MAHCKVLPHYFLHAEVLPLYQKVVEVSAFRLHLIKRAVCIGAVGKNNEKTMNTNETSMKINIRQQGCDNGMRERSQEEIGLGHPRTECV